VRSSERLIAAGLLGSVVVGACAYVLLRHAERSVSDNWPLVSAIKHPDRLWIAEILGASAWIIAVASLAAAGTRFARSSTLATFGQICLAISVPGAILVAVLDLAYARRAQDALPAAIFFGERWQQWNVAGWLMLSAGGLIGLVALGIGLARANRVLRYPALALAATAALILILDGAYAAILLAASLAWTAVVVWRRGPSGATA
jgi:hypothetical protein